MTIQKLKRISAIVVVLLILVNIYYFWSTDAIYGWIVALSGWVAHMFDERIGYGN